MSFYFLIFYWEFQYLLLYTEKALFRVFRNESGMIGLGSHAAQELTMPPGGWPKVLLNRIKISTTDADTSSSTSSPSRVSTTAYQPLDNYQVLSGIYE